MTFEISFTDALILMPKFASTLKALIGNKEKFSEMARTLMNEHCSAVILNKLPRKLGDPGKFLIPCIFPGMDECLALADIGASINLMPLSVWEGLSLPELTPTCMNLELADRSVSKPIGIAKDVSVKGELTLRIENEAITYNLDQTARYSANYNQMKANKIDVIYMACEEYSQEVLGFSDVTASGNPTPYDDPIVSTTSSTLSPFGDNDFLLFEEADAFLGLEDDPNSPKINPFYYDPEGDILLLEAILNGKPLPPLPNHEQYMPSFKKELKVCEAKTVKSSVDKPPEVELKDLPPHLEYAFLEGDNKLPVIIAKELGDEEKSALIKTMEVFMDDFSVFGNSFENCLSHLDKMLQRCEDTNLCFNWEKSHFMVKEGIVLGHKISKNEIEVDKAKVDVIAKLPHPTTVKGAVLGQRHEKHFRPIHYASKMMTDAESNYTTTEKEMLAVVFLRIKCSGGVCTAKKLSTFSKLATMDPRGDIMVLTLPPRRSLMPVSFGPTSTRMPTSLSKTVTRANDKEKFHNVMRCLKTPSRFVKSLTFGALNLWARSHLHEGKNIFSWPSIICRNGLKRKRSPPMTPELFASSLNLSSPDLVMLKYEVTHRLSTAYHPQTSGQVKVSNHGLKRILERTTCENRTSWSDKLDDALWAFRIAYKTPIRCTPYKLVYGNACNLPIELEHYWALKQANFDLAVLGDHWKVQLNKLNELRDHTYENSLIYKEKTKRIHDFKIKNRVFNVGDRVLLFNSRLKIFLGKLKTRWCGPFTITKVFPYGTVELSQANGPNFKVNGHRLKDYFRGDVP
uniref:RNA-directed DNA polymerase n=1 Tax=Tanacetum cinerariifolium TaxID=118510 RepID=A0A699HNA6_TANCI|nr:reverse transcriptase domain-containing protein [Tanacetum cinerariifolium]